MQERVKTATIAKVPEDNKSIVPYQSLDIQFQVSEPQFFVMPDMYHRNPYFLGRTELLEVLREKLCASQSGSYNHRVALFGLGGIGKTQVAVEYVFKFRDTYHSIFWISAATSADLQTGFQTIGDSTRDIIVDQKDATSTAKAVLKWLEKQTSWLLVLDNLDEISIVDGYLPDVGSSGNGHLLITTRNRDASGIPAQGLEVEVFESDDAVDLLLLRATGTKESQPEIRSVGTKIVMELGYLPLAIEHAAAFIRQSLPNISIFLEMYSKSRKRFLERAPKQNYAYSRAVAATFLMSFDAVKIMNPNAAELLTLFAFLNPDGILIDFLQDGRYGLDEPLKTIVGDSFEFGVALADLGQYSLIRRNDETISVHRLVQSVIRDNLEPDRKTQFMESVVELFLSGFPDFTEDRRELCRRYQAQVDGPLQTFSELGTENVAKMAGRLGRFLDEDGKYAAFQSFCRIAVDIHTIIFGAEDHRTLISMDYLARAHRSLGQFKKAAELHEKALEAMQRTLGMEHLDTLISTDNLARAYRSLGQMKEAAELHEKVLEAMQRILGMEHDDTLTTMNNLARAYSSLGQVKEAAQLHGKVLEVRKRTLGMEHRHTFTSMNNLAVAYTRLGQLKEAAELDETVLKTMQRILGMEHPDTLISMNNLAVVYWDVSRHDDAIKLWEVELESCRRVYGEEHKETLASARNLIAKYAEVGRVEDSDRLLASLD
jgi:tetratricopeptide (TPR) repeat protein